MWTARDDIVRREREGMEALSLPRSNVLSEKGRSPPSMPHLDFYFLAHSRRSAGYLSACGHAQAGMGSTQKPLSEGGTWESE